MMKFKPKSEFRSLEISLGLIVVALFVGGRVGWWPYPPLRGLMFLLLVWIFMVLIEIGKALERISPPEQESDEYMG